MEKTTKKIIGKCAPFVINSLWAIALVGILWCGFGRKCLGKYDKSNTYSEKRTESTSITSWNYNLDKEILEACDKAHAEAELYVSTELDKWIDEVMLRVDERFLDDYFSFINVKCREVRYAFTFVANFLHFPAPSAEENLTKELETKIDSMVIQSEVSEARIKNIVDEATVIYFSRLDKEFAKIQIAHKIPVAAWNEYVSQLCGMTMNVENAAINESVTPVSIKVLALSSGTAVALSAKPAINFGKTVAKKVSTKIAERTGKNVVEKTGEKLLVSTGAKTGGKTASRMIPYIGWGITIGTCVWDIIDYKISAEKGKKMLRENIQNYLCEIKRELMGSSSDSIMTSLVLWENDVKKTISENNNLKKNLKQNLSK